MKSMTGYCIKKTQYGTGTITVEMRSVNGKYGDINIKLPKEFLKYEDHIRESISQKIKRGKISVYINLESIDIAEYSILPNIKLAQDYLTSLTELKEKLGLKGEIDINSFVAHIKEAFKTKEEVSHIDEIGDFLKQSVNLAVKDFDDMRQKEGDFLKKEFLKSIDKIGQCIGQIESKAINLVPEQARKIKERIKEILKEIPIDENKVLTEAAFYADRLDISEELARLKSHIKAFLRTIEEPEQIGRKLDFIIQEMNREINTIGSKANDINVSHVVVDVKCEIEKIREQAQNIE